LEWETVGPKIAARSTVIARKLKRTLGATYQKAKGLVWRRSEEEGVIPIVWKAAGAMGYPYGTIVQLLLLTGQHLGVVPLPMTPEQLDARIRDVIASNAALVRAAEIRLE
jgi:hypothetical protein